MDLYGAAVRIMCALISQGMAVETARSQAFFAAKKLQEKCYEIPSARVSQEMGTVPR